MTILSSEVIINRPNGSDFNRRIREKHTDHLGGFHVKTYDKVFVTDPVDYTADDILDTVAYESALDAELAPTVASNSVKIEARLAESEAETQSNTDTEIVAGSHAEVALVVLKYLRKAQSLEDPYQAYLKFTRFNDYRVAQGWAINQVVANLLAVGLTQDEWDEMLVRYTYLSNAQRVTAMENYQLVLDGDPYA